MEMLLCILPGFDGTDKLFDFFLPCLPPNQESLLISYPVDHPLGIDQLVDLAESRIPTDRSVLLLAISFSGPIAIRLLERNNRNYCGGIFCTTFASSPHPFLLQLSFVLPLGGILLFFSWRPILRFFFFDRAAQSKIVRLLQRATRELSAAVITIRLRTLARIDERERLKNIDVPCCYIQAANDRLVPSSALYPFQTFLSRLEVVRIEGPHALLQSRPAESWRAIERFLQSKAK